RLQYSPPLSLHDALPIWECMSFLRRAATVIANTFEEGSDGIITWTTPSGFPASQVYYKLAVCRVYTHLHGLHYIRVASESDDPDPRKHSNGLAPNFVHSLDAAHLCLTVNAALDDGIVRSEERRRGKVWETLEDT